MSSASVRDLKLDGHFSVELADVAAFARGLEDSGFDGMWTTETPHDPFLPLLAAALATGTMTLGTAIATAFTRSPMVTALSAWDLQRASQGRFVLGLGTQVAAHNARRYSTPVERPLSRLRELVAALRHIWGAFQGEHPLDFYHLDLFLPMHSPGPIEHPRIPIYLAAAGRLAYRLAGEVADGVHVHPFHTADYLREVTLPALEEGLERSNRSRRDLTLVSSLFAVIGANAAMDRSVRSQIAFYGSTSAYRPVFEQHGWGGLADRLKPLVRVGDLDAMVCSVDDEVVEAFAIVAPDWSQAASLVRRRYKGILDRVGFYGLQHMTDPADAPAIAAGFGRAGAT